MFLIIKQYKLKFILIYLTKDYVCAIIYIALLYAVLNFVFQI